MQAQHLAIRLGGPEDPTATLIEAHIDSLEPLLNKVPSAPPPPPTICRQMAGSLHTQTSSNVADILPTV